MCECILVDLLLLPEDLCKVQILQTGFPALASTRLIVTDNKKFSFHWKYFREVAYFAFRKEGKYSPIL